MFSTGKLALVVVIWSERWLIVTKTDQCRENPESVMGAYHRAGFNCECLLINYCELRVFPTFAINRFVNMIAFVYYSTVRGRPLQFIGFVINFGQICLKHNKTTQLKPILQCKENMLWYWFSVVMILLLLAVVITFITNNKVIMLYSRGSLLLRSITGQ